MVAISGIMDRYLNNAWDVLLRPTSIEAAGRVPQIRDSIVCLTHRTPHTSILKNVADLCTAFC